MASMRMRLIGIALGWGIVIAADAVQAERAAPSNASSAQISPEDLKRMKTQQELMGIAWVANQHPDVLYRNLGTEAYQDGHKEKALQFFLKAASYADKIAQAMVATMYWNGEGTPVDHPRAYAWMDLAADRGYRDLLIQREIYWSRMSESERQGALEVGRQVYAEYNDKEGLHRLGLFLSRAPAHITGSHAGWKGGNGGSFFASTSSYGPHAPGLQGLLNNTGGFYIDNEKLYGPDLWNPKQYAQLNDMQWNLKSGHVEVGDLEIVRDPAESSSVSH